MNAEEYLSENYNGFFDEFDIQELQDIIEVMEAYHKERVNAITDEMILEFVNNSLEPFKRRGDNINMAKTWILLGVKWLKGEYNKLLKQ